ncbi:MAG: hypothetical protein AB1861_07925 [Cyanobacteriota bacterium]
MTTNSYSEGEVRILTGENVLEADWATMGMKLSARIARVDSIPTPLNQDEATRLGIAN